MTNADYTQKKNCAYKRIALGLWKRVLCCILLFAAFALSLLFSDEIAHSVKSGLLLCANVIIPSVFPFIVISDFLYASLDFSSLKCLGAAFERIFKIRRCGLYAFSLGILCGFPLGVKCARDLYTSGQISRDEAERLIGFSNNTGPAFLVSGVGLGLRGSIEEGVILYAVMVISALICGVIFSFGAALGVSNTEESDVNYRFSFTESIRNAGLNTLNICSYLTFFACLCGLLRKLLGECYLYIAIIPFLEIGSSTSILSKTALLSDMGSLALSAFATGFSGFSVHLQALSFLSGTDISAKRYFVMKLFQGAISLLLAIPAYFLFII